MQGLTPNSDTESALTQPLASDPTSTSRSEDELTQRIWLATPAST